MPVFNPEEYERSMGRGGNGSRPNNNVSSNNSNNVGTDSKDFKFKFFATAKKNEVILKYNLFTKGCSVSNFGVIINLCPWIRLKNVNITDQKFDYKSRKYLIKEGLEATADLSLKIKISDPVKFEFEFQNENGVDIRAEIKDTFEATMRRFFANHTNDELLGRNFDINLPENIEIKNGLTELETRYGIKVISIRCDNYLPPETIMRENAQTAELNANINQAAQQAIINKIEAQSKAEMLNIQYDAYNNAFSGYSEDNKEKLVRTAMYTNSNNPNIHIFAGADNNSLNQAAVVNRVAQNPNANQQNSNSNANQHTQTRRR